MRTAIKVPLAQAPEAATVTPLKAVSTAAASSVSTEPDKAAAGKPAIKAEVKAAVGKGTPFLSNFFQSVLAPVLGLLMLVLVWEIIASGRADFPSPAVTLNAAITLFAEPFYHNGPNDQGIGWNILASLARVGVGFGLAAMIGIPLGFMIGRFAFLGAMFNPIISLLKPVSPLAWLPIGLLVFKAADPAAIWAIFICSIWPMVINTATGVRSVPQDYMNVAKVLNLSEWKIMTKILFPAVLPHMLTGVRLAVGTAWLVIVAAEMLTGGVGIGFWVWDEWNNLNVAHIIIAIGVIGIVGYILEQVLVATAKAFTYQEVRN